MPDKILILGALSDIAQATARRLAADGAILMLTGRDADRLETVATDLRLRGAAAVHVAAVDLAEIDPEASFAEWAEMLGGLDAVLLAYGVLGDQTALAGDIKATRALINVNFASAAGWCLAAATRFERCDHGRLVVIGSVAGDRGRQSNYIYGASKAGLNILIEGLAHRLAPTHARAILIKPGLVATAMTAHMKTGGPLWSTPDRVAAPIVQALQGRTGKTTLYAPGFWRMVMLIVKNLPSAILHRTKM